MRVLWTHNFDPDKRNSQVYMNTRVARVMTRLAIRRYDCVISVSNRMARELRRVTGVPNVVTLPSPVDMTRFIPRDKHAARAELGFAGNRRKWILFNALNLR